jgi:hypothetical protein
MHARIAILLYATACQQKASQNDAFDAFFLSTVAKTRRNESFDVNASPS